MSREEVGAPPPALTAKVSTTDFTEGMSREDERLCLKKERLDLADFGGLCLAAEPLVTLLGGACVIGIVVCVVVEFGELLDKVPFDEGCDTDREGVDRGVVELL